MEAKRAKDAALPVLAPTARLPTCRPHNFSGNDWCIALIHPAQQELKVKSTKIQHAANNEKFCVRDIVASNTVKTDNEI